jgi:RalA-binding protein 1
VPEGWKIEKMYSDVLTLDGKVRAALGKGQVKRLPPLPDAKLFRDNAPAKVDQRRVCFLFLIYFLMS